MDDRKGTGKSSRGGEYRGASRSGKPAGNFGARFGDRSGKPAKGKGIRHSDYQGGKPEGDSFGKTGEGRYGKPGEGRSGKPGEGRFNKSGEGYFGKSGESRFSKSGEGRFSKSGENRFNKNGEGRFNKSGEGRFKKSGDGHFNKSGEDQFTPQKENRFNKPEGDRNNKTSGEGRSNRFSDSRSFRSNSDRTNEPFKKQTDIRPPRQDDMEEKGLAAEDTSMNQLGDLDKLEGRNSVLEALKAGRSINRIFVAKGEREGSVNQIIAIARQSHILIQEIDRAKLDAMSTTHSHQGVIALTAAKDYVEVDEILEIAAASGKPPFLIVLDEITDSHNLGSILRTANAAGVHGVIIPKRRAVGLTSVVSKASAGAIEYVPVARVTNIAQTLESLKKQNIWVVGTDSTGDKSYFEADLTGPVALVIGSEGEGMGKLVRESCDFVVNIPMMGQITSLNAAVAGAIVTYEILRQRMKKKS